MGTVSLPLTRNSHIKRFPPNKSSQNAANPAKSTYRVRNRSHRTGAPRRRSTVTSAPATAPISCKVSTWGSKSHSRKQISDCHRSPQNTTPRLPNRFSTRSGQAHCTSAKALPRKKWTVFLYIYFISSTCSMCPVSRSSESVIAASCKFSPLMRTVRLPPDTATSSVL